MTARHGIGGAGPASLLRQYGVEVKLPIDTRGGLRADEATLKKPLADPLPIDLVVLGGAADTVRSPKPNTVDDEPGDIAPVRVKNSGVST